MAAIRVAVGIVLAGDQVLIAKRAQHKHQGGLWEFPGGKIEPEETPEQALARELDEELGLDLSTASLQSLVNQSHQYADVEVELCCYLVRGATGQAQGLEGQAIAWVECSTLSDYEFPAANRDIIRCLHEYLTPAVLASS